MEEIWKDIEGYENLYQVSNLGRIKSLPKDRNYKNKGEFIMKTPINKRGYISTTLTLNKKQTTYRTHRLIAKAFIPNSENKKEVNHINGIRHDNRAENLEWCTRSENSLHSYATKLQIPPWIGKFGQNHASSKLVLDISTGIFYESRKEAAMAKNIPLSTLTMYLTGQITNRTSLRYV